MGIAMATKQKASETVTGLMAALAERDPDRAAMIEGETTISFGELDARSRRVAAGLARHGVGSGDRVALWLPTVPAYMILDIACARLGAIAVAINTRFRAVDLADLVGRSGAKLLAYWPGFRHIDFAGTLAQSDPAAMARLETLVIYGSDDSAAPADSPLVGRTAVDYASLEASEPLEADRASPDAPCNIFASSGTTRAPKMILHSQRTITRHAATVARRFGFDAPDARSLQILPLSGVFGFSQMMGALAGTCPSVLMSAFDAEAAVTAIGRDRITHLIGTDLVFQRLLDCASADRPFPSVRLAAFAAFTPSITGLVEQGDARGIPFVGLYGSSEVQALFALQPVDGTPDRRAKAGGEPVSGDARVRARDLESGAILPDGEPGELELSGPSRMVGYFEDDPGTAEAVTEDGYIRSGDLGYTESDGRFVFLSRRGDVLRLGGFLVHPVEIEAFIQEHPGIEGCQVIGVERPEGTRAVAFVTCVQGASFDPRALRSHCLRGLAKYKLPERFIALDAFPMTESPNGMKVQRAKLRQMALEAAESRRKT